MDERLSVGSLFSGIGGIELGFERAGGFKTEWFVERDIYCQLILKKHWPQAIVYDDVATLDFGAVQKVDILVGGFPCQDISNAGKRVGITGSRSSLWKHFCRAIGILRPKYALIENVAALANRGLDVVLADLAEIGYAAEWYNISASSVGAPHRRERGFSSWPTPTAADTFTDKLKSSQHKEGSKHSVNLSQAVHMWRTPSATDLQRGGHKSQAMKVMAGETHRKSGHLRQITLAMQVHMFPTPTASDATMGAIIGKKDKFYLTTTGMPRKVNQNGVDGSVGLGRLVQMFPTPTTQDNRGKGNYRFDKSYFVEENTPGQLNPTWVEWLMGFPAGWTELSASEMQLFHKLRKSLQKQSKKGRD